MEPLAKEIEAQKQEMDVMKIQIKDLLTMQGTLMHQLDTMSANQTEEIEEPIGGDVDYSGESSGLPGQPEAQSVKDSVLSAMHKEEKEPKAEKQGD